MVGKGLLVLGLGLPLWLAAAVVPGREHSRHGGMNVYVEREGVVDDCRQLRVTFDGADAARAEETLSAPRPRGALRLRAPVNSGIFVQGGDRSDVSVTVCKAASIEQDLSRIGVSFENGELLARGPESRDWVVYFLVRAPRGVDLDLDVINGPASVRGSSGFITARAQNGPLAFEDSAGQIQAEAKNGPISFKGCSGNVSATAVNGPISVSGNGGDVRITTQNGPISVKLSGTRWDGTLEAHARNGPLTLLLPDGFASAVRVESSGSSPFRCRARACAEARKNWDDAIRQIDFGDSGSPVVRLSTVNGPVSIHSDESLEE